MTSYDDFHAQRNDFWARKASERQASGAANIRSHDARFENIQGRPRRYSEGGLHPHSPSYRPPPIASQPMPLEEQRQRQGRSVSDASSVSAHPRSFPEGNARYGRRPSSVQRPPSLYRPSSVQPPLYQEESHRSHASHGGYGRSPSTVSRHRSRDGRVSPRSPQKAYLGEKNEGYVSPTPMRYAGAKKKIKPAAATAGGAVIGATGVAGAAHVATHDDSCCGFGDCFGCGDGDGCDGCDGCGEFCECLEMCA